MFIYKLSQILPIFSPSGISKDLFMTESSNKFLFLSKPSVKDQGEQLLKILFNFYTVLKESFLV